MSVIRQINIVSKKESKNALNKNAVMFRWIGHVTHTHTKGEIWAD